MKIKENNGFGTDLPQLESRVIPMAKELDGLRVSVCVYVSLCDYMYMSVNLYTCICVCLYVCVNCVCICIYFFNIVLTLLGPLNFHMNCRFSLPIYV